MRNFQLTKSAQLIENLNFYSSQAKSRTFKDTSDLLIEINQLLRNSGYSLLINDIFDVSKKDWFSLSIHALNVKHNLNLYTLARLIGMSM